MSHEIEFTDGRANYIGTRRAWHRLGKVFERLFGIDDIREHAPATLLRVDKQPLESIVDPTMSFTIPEDMHVNVREDGKILAVVGDKYEVVQGDDAYEWGETMARIITGRDEPLCLSAGSIREGRQFFFVFEGTPFDVNGEHFEGNLNLLCSHDGSIVNLLVPSHIDTVCANTYTLNLGMAAAWKFRHTAEVSERMADALAAQRAYQKRQGGFVETVERLQATPVTMRDFDLLRDLLMPVPEGDKVSTRTINTTDNARTAVRELFTSPLVDGFENTGWAWVQAVNSYEQWLQPVRRTKGTTEETTRALRQFDSLTKGQPLTAKAVELVLA